MASAKAQLIKIAKLKQELIEWTRDPINKSILYDEPRRKLEDGIGNSSTTIGQFSAQLRWLATWYANIGTVEVISGFESGWSNIGRAANCKQWQIRASRASYLQKSPAERENWTADTLNNVCLNLALLITLGDEASAALIGDTLQSGIADGCWGTEMEAQPFEAFIILLFSRWHAPDSFQTLKSKLPIIGVYDGVFQHWNDDNLTQVISRICDYHVDQARDLSDDESPEFHSHPYAIFPVEVLALQRIRTWLGTSTPMIQHPLLDAKLTKVPKEISLTPDQLIENVINKLRKKL
jgi:hypothetical protein